MLVAWQSYHDTTPLIGYAKDSKDAAIKSAKAAADFADTASGMNRNISDAVAKLNLQAAATHDLAVAAKQQAADAKQVAQTTAATYDASLRPYVGVEDDHTDVDPTKFTITHLFTLKNSGQIPAASVTTELKAFLNDGETMNSASVAEAQNGLTPGNHFIVPNQLTDGVAKAAITGAGALVIALRWTYTWRDKSETDCTNMQYDAERKRFGIIGNACSRWDAEKP